MRYVRADLGTAPGILWCGHDITLFDGHLDFIQANEKWAVFLYQHDGVVQLDRHALPFRSGDLLIVPPGSRVCHARVGSGTPHFWMQFTLPGCGYVMALPALSSLHQRDIDRFINATKEVWRTTHHAKAVIWSLLWELSASEGVLRENADVYLAEDWIRRNIDRPFTLAEMARELDMPKSSLTRLFQVEHRMTIKQFIQDVRVREAVRLLGSTDTPIKSVALAIGIGNAQQFNKLIRGVVGLSPREIRNRGITRASGATSDHLHMSDPGLVSDEPGASENG